VLNSFQSGSRILLSGDVRFDLSPGGWFMTPHQIRGGDAPRATARPAHHGLWVARPEVGSAPPRIVPRPAQMREVKGWRRM
jgi:hypothetical protein